jgi:hypothetical protein
LSRRSNAKAEVTRPTVIALCVFLLLGGATTFADVAQADSPDFTLNTTGAPLGVGGTAQADSPDFTLNTTGAPLGVGGTAQADSLDFTLNTTGAPLGVGGTAQADSLDFTLNTTGVWPSVFADSADFVLDTRNALDIGLRAYDGNAIIKIAAEPGSPTSPGRITKNGTTYGIVLVDTNAPDASKIRIQTSSGVKAWKKLP